MSGDPENETRSDWSADHDSTRNDSTDPLGKDALIRASVEHSKRAPPCDLCNEMCGKSCVDGLAQTFQSLPPIVIQTVPKHRHVRKLQVFFPWSSQLVAWS